MHPNLVTGSCPPALPSAFASGPASNWSPARAFSSTSGLNLQLLTARRFSGRRRALVRACALRDLSFDLSLFLGPSVSPPVRPLGRSRGLRSQIEVCSRLAPFACAQPSCRLPAPALDAGLAPLVSCHSFQPAFWPASLRRVGSRLGAFVVKRPSGMPLVIRCFGLSPLAPSGPRAGFQSLRPFLQPSGYRPLVCASADCSGLAAFASCGCQLPTACGPPGSRSSPACAFENPPSRLLPPAFGLRLAPLWNRPPGPASASPLSLKSGLRLASTCRVFRSGWGSGLRLRFHPSGVLPRPFSKASACASASRPALPDSPSGSGPPVPGLRPAPSARPSSLPSRLPSGLRPPVSAPAPPRARSAI